MFEEYKEHSLATYGGFCSDEKEILKSASGGLATAIAKQFIREGGTVVGVGYTEDCYSAEYIFVDNLEQLELLRGSKLFDFDKKDTFVQVENRLKQGEKLLFFGLPCVIASLMLYLKGRFDDQLITCELICSGQTFRKVHLDYCKWLEKKFKSKIIYINVRSKRNLWLPEYLHVEFANGKIYEKPFKRTEYGIGFKILKRTCCCNCDIRGNKRVGDIMLGDFWGSGAGDPFWNKLGTSVVFVHTKKGKDFIESVEGICLKEVDFEYAVNENKSVINRIKVYEDRDEIIDIFQKSDLFVAMKSSPMFINMRRNYRYRWLIRVYRKMRELCKGIRK